MKINMKRFAVFSILALALLIGLTVVMWNSPWLPITATCVALIYEFGHWNVMKILEKYGSVKPEEVDSIQFSKTQLKVKKFFAI